jgi:hypothetical protein
MFQSASSLSCFFVLLLCFASLCLGFICICICFCLFLCVVTRLQINGRVTCHSFWWACLTNFARCRLFATSRNTRGAYTWVLDAERKQASQKRKMQNAPMHALYAGIFEREENVVVRAASVRSHMYMHFQRKFNKAQHKLATCGG